MQKQIEILNRNISYTLTVSRKARYLRLAVFGGGNLVVTTPQHISEKAVEEFMLRKAKWILSKIDYFVSLPPPPKKRSSKIEYIKYKALAKKIARDKLQYFNQFYGFRWNKISIKNQSTRWGSCSKQGNINFNYKIALLPEKFVDYIIVHELCHLAELNHSRNFWKLVAKTIPDYVEVKKTLRYNNHQLIS